MPLNNGIPSIIHAASSAVTSAFTYTQVYAQAGATPTINNVAVTMIAGGIINVLVKTISPTADVFVLGDKVNTSDPGGTTGVIL